MHKVQHIQNLSLELDLSKTKLTCVVGRNGVGKTTLVRALRNISHSDTFVRTAPAGIFSTDSYIHYRLNDTQLKFYFDERAGSINCKQVVPQHIRTICSVELPIPHGTRFNFFRTVSRADRAIRKQIVLEEYSQPAELVMFLSDIYSSDKYLSLIETKVGSYNYYCILLDDGKYVREDYLSSGEYFLINLYRTIRGSARLVVVDEIDISLDAAAQVQLVQQLREMCVRYGCNVLFTTHSLAMMRTLHESELFYMEQSNERTVIEPVSYSYVRSLLFGFSGWDRYILTEDHVLSEFLYTLIHMFCENVFFQYKIIHIGGGSQVVDLLRRNRNDGFLSEPDNVIAILDGDQRETEFARDSDVYLLPFESIEKALHAHYVQDGLSGRLAKGREFTSGKDLFNYLVQSRIMSAGVINRYLCERHHQELKPLVAKLRSFLTQ